MADATLRVTGKHKLSPSTADRYWRKKKTISVSQMLIDKKPSCNYDIAVETSLSLDQS